jgi:hypothetical protein
LIRFDEWPEEECSLPLDAPWAKEKIVGSLVSKFCIRPNHRRCLFLWHFSDITLALGSVRSSGGEADIIWDRAQVRN